MKSYICNYLPPCFSAFLASIAVTAAVDGGVVHSSSLWQLVQTEIDGMGIDRLVIVLALLVFFLKYWEVLLRAGKWVTHLLSILLACCMLVGMSYAELNSWDFLFGSRKSGIFALILLLGFSVLFDLALCVLYQWMGNIRSHTFAWEEERAGNIGAVSVRASASFSGTGEKRAEIPDGSDTGNYLDNYRHIATKRSTLRTWIGGHAFLCFFLVICAGWFPYLLYYFPGSVTADGMTQIRMAYGIQALTNHHPWLLSIFFGLLMRAGSMISDNFGIFLIVSVSYVAEALCYAWVCVRIQKWGGLRFCLVALAFYSIVPAFGAYAQAVVKDGLFAALAALFFVEYIDLCMAYSRGREVCSIRKRILILFLVGLAVCFTRNNGIYLVIPADLLLFFFLVKPKRRYALILTGCVLLTYWGVEEPLADAFDVTPGSTKEMLSIPFQQTARYVLEYPEDVTEEERAAIDAILDYASLAENYDPDLSDPVKSTYHSDDDSENLIRYFTDAWFPMLLRHPAVYVEATLNGSYGYFYPFSNITARTPFKFYQQEDTNFDFHYIFPETMRSKLSSYANAWRNVTGLALLVNPGTYTWILLIMAGWLIYSGRGRDLLTLAAPFLNLAVCVASPVNGYLRYALPLVACTPVILYWCCCGGGAKLSERETDIGTACEEEAVAENEGKG